VIRSIVVALLALVGVALVVVGVAAWSAPAALILAGLVAVHVARTLAASDPVEG
jgi:hypothetical protein